MKSIRALHPAYDDDIADLKTRRPVPGPGLEQIDPFLFLNHHGPQRYAPGNRGLPFGPHPHRGFETVTFILDGELAHRDSSGHDSVIRAGGVQWMTAGRGLVHSELSPDAFKRDGGPLEILQLWVNLPGRLKLTKPAYIGLQREQISSLAADDGKVAIDLVSGTWNGHDGPIRSIGDVTLATIALQPGGRLRWPGLAGRNVFFYVIRGALRIGTEAVLRYTLVEFDLDGDAIEFSAEDGPALVLFGHAVPIGEPVVSYGPFVMNTQEEIQAAIADYRAGRFES